MAEVIATLAIAGLTGLGALHSKLHSRILSLDNRIDGLELRVAKEYVAKAELNEIIEKVEAHMIRIENKLDKIIFK